MKAFDDAIEKLLWSEKRLGKDSIRRTTAESSLQIPKSYAQWLGKLADADGYIHVGPIPKGTPINLIANTNLELGGLRKDVERRGLTGDKATQRLLQLVPDFYQLNSCPDFVEDRGHYFGTGLPDLDK